MKKESIKINYKGKNFNISYENGNKRTKISWGEGDMKNLAFQLLGYDEMSFREASKTFNSLIPSCFETDKYDLSLGVFAGYTNKNHEKLSLLREEAKYRKMISKTLELRLLGKDLAKNLAKGLKEPLVCNSEMVKFKDLPEVLYSFMDGVGVNDNFDSSLDVTEFDMPIIEKTISDIYSGQVFIDINSIKDVNTKVIGACLSFIESNDNNTLRSEIEDYLGEKLPVYAKLN